MVLVGSQTQLFHASKMIFDVPFQTKLSSLYPFWFVYLFLSGIVGTFFLKRKVEIRYPCKHVLWRVDICNILLRGGIFPNILLLINPKYYQLLSEGHPFQIFLCLQRIGAVTLAGRIIGQQTCPPPQRCMLTAIMVNIDVCQQRCRQPAIYTQRDVGPTRCRARAKAGAWRSQAPA